MYQMMRSGPRFPTGDGQRAATITTGNPVRALMHRSGIRWVLFLGVHVPLALLANESVEVATLHALATFAVGLWWALAGRRPERVAYVCAYIVGAEVLWRMTEAQVFWEFGKYSVVAIMFVALFQSRRLGAPGLPILYFVLLLPSCILTITGLDLAEARDEISFNLSGPLALTVSVWYCSRLNLSRVQLRRLFLVLIGPVVGISTIALYSTATATAIRFGDNSNFVTSGGFGPNQVSAALGLGALLALLLIVDGATSRSGRLLLLGVMVVLATQSALTFSRGGLYMAGGAALIGTLFLAKDARTRLTIVAIAVVLYLLASLLVVPFLDSFTEGALVRRLQDTRPTGRDLIALADLETWQENLILGVGPGLGKLQRAALFRAASAHIEFSRLVAEHGTLGFVALLVLCAMAVRGFRQAHTAHDRGVVASLLVWSFLYMATNDMRTVAPAFLVGLVSARIVAPEGSRVSITGSVFLRNSSLSSLNG